MFSSIYCADGLNDTLYLKIAQAMGTVGRIYITWIRGRGRHLWLPGFSSQLNQRSPPFDNLVRHPLKNPIFCTIHSYPEFVYSSLPLPLPSLLCLQFQSHHSHLDFCNSSLIGFPTSCLPTFNIFLISPRMALLSVSWILLLFCLF